MVTLSLFRAVWLLVMNVKQCLNYCLCYHMVMDPDEFRAVCGRGLFRGEVKQY